MTSQLLLKDIYVSNVVKQKVLRKYLKKAKMCVNFTLGEFIHRNFGW
jgi:hypothetical protein